MAAGIQIVIKSVNQILLSLAISKGATPRAMRFVTDESLNMNGLRGNDRSGVAHNRVIEMRTTLT